MVLSCIVPGCTEKKRKGHAGISFHHLPVKDRERCKEWLRAANNPKYGEDVELDKLRIRRICSLHFRPEDFELNVLGMKRAALKETAVPSVLLDLVTQRRERPGPSGRTPVDKRSRVEVDCRNITHTADFYLFIYRSPQKHTCIQQTCSVSAKVLVEGAEMHGLEGRCSVFKECNLM